VFELQKGSSTITTVASFNGSNGRYPSTGVIMDGAGNLYGTTAIGPVFNPNKIEGSVFEIASGSQTITTLATFQDDGTGQLQETPSGLILDGAGNLYGTSNVIFQFISPPTPW
jgi:hypothetical protein